MRADYFDYDYFIRIIQNKINGHIARLFFIKSPHNLCKTDPDNALCAQHTCVTSALFIQLPLTYTPIVKSPENTPLTHLLSQMAAILADDIFKCIFLNEKVRILIKNSLKPVCLDPRGSTPYPRPIFSLPTPTPLFIYFFSGTPAQNSEFWPPLWPPRPFSSKAPLPPPPPPPLLSSLTG